MSLLAYAVRRAVGALVVLLVVLWLIYFGVVHAMSPPNSDPAPDYFLQFWQLAQQWNVAALQVGLALALLLGLGGVWRLRRAT
jgi:succinate dehydrogenase hydrophobic anchor subunit